MTRWIEESLFVADAPVPTLRGATCAECGTTTFPAQTGCPRCGAERMDPVALPREGRVWSYTVQYFEPKAPFRHDGAFEPYGVAYVDLGPVIVEGRLLENDPERVRIGDRVRLTTLVAHTDGFTPVTTFAFALTGSEGDPA